MTGEILTIALICPIMIFIGLSLGALLLKIQSIGE